MYNNVVSKFGGSSLASAENLQKVVDIIKGDKAKKFVVVSAPGKRFKDDTKITDLLYQCAKDITKIEEIESRFAEMIKEINSKLDLTYEFAALREYVKEAQAKKQKSGKLLNIDYIASRGEYFTAKIVADILGYNFVDASDIIFFDGEKYLEEESNEVASKKLSKLQNAVIPGFYGFDKKSKEVKTFSRGGSDISGSIIARAVNADIYQNWTDVDGFCVIDPCVVKNPPLIDKLSYKELRELSYMGASVLHPDSIFPVRIADIPVNIKNTFNTNAPGTLILPSKLYNASVTKDIKPDADNYIPITGIAGKKDYTIIHIEKSMLNNEKGITRRMLSILEEFDVNYEHMPTGIDSMSLVIANSEMQDCATELAEKIREEVKPSIFRVIENIALVAVVGQGCASRPQTSIKIFNALKKANLRTWLINKSTADINIIVGINNADYEIAMSALYQEFFTN